MPPDRSVGLKQHRPEVAIVRRRDGSGKLCVFVFHIGASKNETSLRPSATSRCIRGRLSTLPVANFSASSNVKCRAQPARRGGRRISEFRRDPILLSRSCQVRVTVVLHAISNAVGCSLVSGSGLVASGGASADVEIFGVAILHKHRLRGFSAFDYHDPSVFILVEAQMYEGHCLWPHFPIYEIDDV